MQRFKLRTDVRHDREVTRHLSLPLLVLSRIHARDLRRDATAAAYRAPRPTFPFALRAESGRPRLLPAGVSPGGGDEGKRRCWPKAAIFHDQPCWLIGPTAGRDARREQAGRLLSV